MQKPKSLEELRKFYLEEYCPLYRRFITEHQLPQELHAEVAAAFDHLMRNPISNGNINTEDFDRVIGHLKRATFDCFKLTFEKGIRERYDHLSNIRYENVEDGLFQPRIRKLFNDAKEIAVEARKWEHPDVEDYESWGKSFEIWKQILPIADQFKAEENSDKILRIKNPKWSSVFYDWKKELVWIIIGIILSNLIILFSNFL